MTPAGCGEGRGVLVGEKYGSIFFSFLFLFFFFVWSSGEEERECAMTHWRLICLGKGLTILYTCFYLCLTFDIHS